MWRRQSDAVLVAPRLVMVLESIRAHFGAPVVIHSGYRTPQYNAKVERRGPQPALLWHGGGYFCQAARLRQTVASLRTDS